MTSRKAMQRLQRLKTILEKNNLLDRELRSDIWDLEDYIMLYEKEEETVNNVYDIKEDIQYLILEITKKIDML